MSGNLAFLSAGFSAATGLPIYGDKESALTALRSGPAAGAAAGAAASAWGDWLGSIAGALARFGVAPESALRKPEEEEEEAGIVRLGIKELFGVTALQLSGPPLPSVRGGGQTFTVQIHLLRRNTRLSLDDVQSTWKVQRLRAEGAKKLELRAAEVALSFNGDILTDDNKKLSELGVEEGSVIYALKVHPGQRVGMFLLDPSALQPSFDFDLTGEKDDGTVYMRGGHRYHRPYGWRRHAVRVLGEYENDKWLGKDGIRTASTPGEWPVSYHGTRREALDPILDEGLKKIVRDLHGHAVYSSPALEMVARHYSKPFTYEGKEYNLVLQNRVDPKHLTIIPPEQTGYKDFPYWLSPPADYEKGRFPVRPYGILTKEV